MENLVTVPTKAQILVIGGGPAGSYAASVLAREGFHVVLLEATKFPRYHIGESLLSSIRPFLKFIDAEDTIKSYGFTVKPGAAFKLEQHKREGYTDFVGSLGLDNASWNVTRADFDDLMLKHAAKCGVTVIEETKVVELRFHGERPASAAWVSRNIGKGEIAFDYLVDASGRNGVMSTKYLHNRHFNKSLNNVACWGYWEGATTYMPGTTRENAPWTEALPDQSGWAWFIPLHDGSASVGIVMDQEISNHKKMEVKNASGATNLEAYYLQEVWKVPGITRFLEKATLRQSGQPGAVKSASDYSYSASSYAGDHYRIAGDAGAFIDPLFSSGVHLAFRGALSAALTICASIRGLTTETEAQHWHTSKVGTSYTRFLLVVLSVYVQIRNKSPSIPILSDIDEDHFDRAFELFRPIIQGTTDVDKTLTEDELQKTLDFCRRVVVVRDPDIGKAVREQVPPELIDPESPVVTQVELGSANDETTDEPSGPNVPKRSRLLGFLMESFTIEDHFGFEGISEHGKLGSGVSS